MVNLGNYKLHKGGGKSQSLDREKLVYQTEEHELNSVGEPLRSFVNYSCTTCLFYLEVPLSDSILSHPIQ